MYMAYIKLMVVLLAVVALARFTLPGQYGGDDNGRLLLPDGFEAVMLVDSIGPARHIAVRENGDIYVKLRRNAGEGSIVALRDADGDGIPEIIRKFGVYTEDRGGFHTEAEIHEGYLYVSTQLHVYRYRLLPGELLPDMNADTLVIDDHAHGSHEHITKPLAFDDKGNMYVPFGAGSNACQEINRTPEVPGVDPCDQLVDHGGIWRFDKNKKNQTQADGYMFASGLRSIVGIDWNPVDKSLYAVVHGRDDLHRMWPNKFVEYDNTVLPAEEFVRVEDGSHFGWPYCYYDQLQGKKVLAPEYGGDGKEIGRCANYDHPLIGFPGHFAPNDVVFYRGEQFPDHYRNGAFIAFHGSTIRNPYPQAGYFVAFVPFENGDPGEWEVFVNGFAEVDPIINTSDATHRPVGLTVGPDGSLYVTDSVRGTIWRITYTGDKAAFGAAQLARMREEKRSATNIRTPDREKDNLERDMPVAGEKVYVTYCAGCHQRDGNGASPRYPPLAGTDWVTGDKSRMLSVILKGMQGPIEVNGEIYDNVMPQHSFLDDESLAQVATYIRQSFGNQASAVTVEEVKEVREALMHGSN
jgi:glucose/arabinose dehydrogenase